MDPDQGASSKVGDGLKNATPFPMRFGYPVEFAGPRRGPSPPLASLPTGPAPSVWYSQIPSSDSRCLPPSPYNPQPTSLPRSIPPPALRSGGRASAARRTGLPTHRCTYQPPPRARTRTRARKGLATHIIENGFLNGESIRLDGAIRMPKLWPSRCPLPGWVLRARAARLQPTERHGAPRTLSMHRTHSTHRMWHRRAIVTTSPLAILKMKAIRLSTLWCTATPVTVTAVEVEVGGVRGAESARVVPLGSGK